MLNVLIVALLLAQQEKPPDKCALSGTVVDSVTGVPLGKVDLQLEPTDRNDVAVTKSDAQGHFSLVDVTPGSYHLRAERSGYLKSTYGARRAEGSGPMLRLDAGQKIDQLTFKLVPSAVIAGTVRDADGEPMEGAHVVLSRFSYEYGSYRIEGYDSVDTNDRGEYRFARLASGKYYVGAEPSSDVFSAVDHSVAPPTEVSVATLYPGVTNAAAAVPIEVTPGRHAENMDIKMVRTRAFRVSGRVVNLPGSARMTLALRDAKNPGIWDLPLRTSTQNADGDFELRGVPPGAWELKVSGKSLHGRASVVVGEADVDGVRVELTAGADLKLRVTEEGSDKASFTDSELGYFLTSNGREGFGSWEPGGERFTIRNVPPDHYMLKLEGTELRKFYVKSVIAGSNDILADGLTIAGGDPVMVGVVLGADGGFLQGVVRDKDGQPVAGATVLLAPDQRMRADRYVDTTSDVNGHYEFPAISPGGYRLFGWGDVEPKAWNDPEFLKGCEDLSQALTIGSGERKTADLRAVDRSGAK